MSLALRLAHTLQTHRKELLGRAETALSRARVASERAHSRSGFVFRSGSVVQNWAGKHRILQHHISKGVVASAKGTLAGWLKSPMILRRSSSLAFESLPKHRATSWGWQALDSDHGRAPSVQLDEPSLGATRMAPCRLHALSVRWNKDGETEERANHNYYTPISS
jgi:hypothetical protein